MNLSFKDLRFIIEAIEHQINAYQKRLQVIEDTEEEDAADLGNDIKFLEILNRDTKTTLEHTNLVKFLSYDHNLWLDTNNESSANSKDVSFQILVKL